MPQESEVHEEVVEGEEGTAPETAMEVEPVTPKVLEAELQETREALQGKQEQIQALEGELADALSHYRDALLTGPRTSLRSWYRVRPWQPWRRPSNVPRAWWSVCSGE